jgi:hypothetical protein
MRKTQLLWKQMFEQCLLLFSSQSIAPNTIIHKTAILYAVVQEWPPLWSSGQSSWLQIQRTGVHSRHYQKKKVMGLERGPLSLVSTTEELLERKSGGSGLENREYGRRDTSCWPRGTLYPQKWALTSLTIGGRSVVIVRSQTQTTEIFCLFFLWCRSVTLCL